MVIDNEKVNPFWICLPFNLRNAVSVYQSQWQCWNPDEKDKWVRELPQHSCVISDPNYFSFFRKGMEFEEFIIDFGKWFAKDKKTACLVAIRSDESLNRFRTIKNLKKERYNNLGYSTKIIDNLFNFYPIYDWRTEDIWTAVGKFNYKYNKIYDLMYMQGKSIHESRLCQPYGDDQRKGLELFRVCEPKTWFKIVERVSGANYGNLYANTLLMGSRTIVKPDDHTWKSYAKFLLETLPKHEKEWYLIKFKVFFKWWEKHGFPFDEIPDDDLPQKHLRLKKPDGAYHKRGPSWKRICKCILKNDKLCKSLSFSGTKKQYEKYNELRNKYAQEEIY
ncbi:MAG: DUF3440 domain-containing protein [Candidatus Heimdallarchaeaceae archaeon]